MRTVGWFLVLLGVAGCPDRGDKPVNVPIQTYIDAPDQVLPNAVVGQPYDAVIRATGGTLPYVWTAAPEAVIPVGLTLSANGHVVGTPAEAGEFTFAALVHDDAGRENRVDLTLSVGIVPGVVRCGETIEGRFAGNGFAGADADLTDLQNLAWLAVEVPDELATRVDLVFRNEAVAVLYVELPNLVVGSGDLAEDYAQFFLEAGSVPSTVGLDAGSSPSLTGYLTQPTIPLLLVGQTSGDWELSVDCTDGPIFVTLPQYPTRLGDPLDIDYDVYGDNTGVRIWTDDPLPEWMVWDETTGKVTGTALEAGTWEFTIRAETPDGRTRAERSLIGVYEVQDIGCGQTVPLETSEGYLDGDFYAFYDPRGFAVYRLPLPAGIGISSANLKVAGETSHYLGLSMPNPDWLRFYGGAERRYENGAFLDMDVDPTTYPALDHYLDPDVGELYFSAGSLDSGPADMLVTVTCDAGPRPNFAALPVVQPLTVSAFQLEALGGTAPYAWSATGLPSGLKLSAGGELSGQTGAIGTYDVDLTVTDKLGASFTREYPMFVGNDDACEGYRQITCGESVDGEFTLPYFSDGSGKDSTKVFCVVNSEDRDLAWEIYSDEGELRLDIADPGRSADDMFNDNKGTYVDFVPTDSVAGVGVDEFSWPNIEDYRGIPLLFAVRAYDPGGWTVHLTCP